MRLKQPSKHGKYPVRNSGGGGGGGGEAGSGNVGDEHLLWQWEEYKSARRYVKRFIRLEKKD